MRLPTTLPVNVDDTLASPRETVAVVREAETLRFRVKFWAERVAWGLYKFIVSGSWEKV